MNYHLTPISGNAKTGPIPVSTTSGKSCPHTCPFNTANAGGCYAASGPLALHWRKITEGERGTDLEGFTAQLSETLANRPARQLWRLNQAGDLPGIGNEIDAAALAKITAVNVKHNARGWTYTHKPMLSSEDATNAPKNRRKVKTANRKMTVNVSGNSLAHADQLAELAVAPVVCVLPAGVAHDKGKLQTPAGRNVVICPAQMRDNVTCATCGLCSNNSPSRPIIGFIAHGTGAKKASAIASA